VKTYGYLVLALGWIVWVTPFILAKRSGEPPKVMDRRARWGLMLQGAGYTVLWQGRFWERELTAWQLGFAILFLALAGLLSWTGTGALGRQLRVDAGLSADHRLIMEGPYRVVRHPIYASMLCLLLGNGFIISSPLLFAIATIFFVAGTEIRVHIEERLLAAHFGEQYREYRRRVPAYIPFAR
jgi:protein-S-isoprenylcysteine O-methyltransferase Ste14